MPDDGFVFKQYSVWLLISICTANAASLLQIMFPNPLNLSTTGGCIVACTYQTTLQVSPNLPCLVLYRVYIGRQWQLEYQVVIF